MIELEFKALCKGRPEVHKDILVVNDINRKENTTFFFRGGEHEGLKFMEEAAKRHGIHLEGICCWAYFDIEKQKPNMTKLSDELPDIRPYAHVLVVHEDEGGGIAWGLVTDERGIKEIMVDPKWVRNKKPKTGLSRITLALERTYWTKFKFTMPADDLYGKE